MTKDFHFSVILQENLRRREAEKAAAAYDPESGRGCTCPEARTQRRNPFTGHTELIPEEMTRDPDWPLMRSAHDWRRLRCRHDFEYWAVTCARIKDKVRPELVPLRLNRGQRRVVEALERDRLAGRPMRLIVLKARQWGCTTVVEMYIAWMQCCRVRDWHSLLCSQVQGVSGAIRGMLETMLRHYPAELWEGDEPPAIRAFQGQSGIREIAGRNCHITIASSESVNSVRGSDYAMAHLTEVAFWKDTPSARPTDFIRTICGAIAREPLTLIVLESTANGVGNFFHREWYRSIRGAGDKRAVFVPWYEIDIYQEAVTDPEALWNAMDDYERALWQEHGLTLERIQWYHSKRAEMADHTAFMAEYPTTPEEAFACTGAAVFAPEAIARLRPATTAPCLTGEISAASGCLTGEESLHGLRFMEDSTGKLKVWRQPQAGESYIVAVDVGGRTAKADWSVIAVLRNGDHPEVVAQWRGHTDHDLLTWNAARIAAYYNTALLVFESNSLEHCAPGGCAPPAQGAYMLHELALSYPNLYYRQSAGEDGGRLPGFHTNRATKQMIITELIAAVRDGSYTERDPMALDELAVYELRPDGSYAATDGNHDDILMTRAIALHVSRLPHLRVTLSSDPDLAAFVAPWQHEHPL